MSNQIDAYHFTLANVAIHHMTASDLLDFRDYFKATQTDVWGWHEKPTLFIQWLMIYQGLRENNISKLVSVFLDTGRVLPLSLLKYVEQYPGVSVGRGHSYLRSKRKTPLPSLIMDTSPNVNLMEKCPLCDKDCVRRCKCPNGDRWCELDHHWRPCSIHRDERVILPTDSHPGRIKECNCRRMNEIQPKKQEKEKYGDADPDEDFDISSDEKIYPGVMTRVTNLLKRVQTLEDRLATLEEERVTKKPRKE
jgi:hypothetical protein